MAEGQPQRHRTVSEAMHDMLEQAIQTFYAKQASSVFVAFADLYFRDFGRAYHWLRQENEMLRIRQEMANKASAEQPGPGQEQGGGKPGSPS